MKKHDCAVKTPGLTRKTHQSVPREKRNKTLKIKQKNPEIWVIISGVYVY